MNNQINPKIIGGFVLGALILIVVVFLVFGSGRYFKDTEKYVIYFRSSVNGLKLGAPVKLRGIELGQVNDITPLFDEEGNFYVQVIIETYGNVVKSVSRETEEVKSDPAKQLKILIERGFRAQLNVQSLVTGQLYIKVDYFPETPLEFCGFNPKYLEIPSIPKPGEYLSENIEKTVENIKNIPLDDISASFISTLNGIDSLTHSTNFKNMQENLSLALVELKEVLQHIDQKLDPLSDSFFETSLAAKESFKRTDEVLNNINNIAQDNRYILFSALREFSSASRAIKNLADYLERNPGALIYGKK